MQINRVNAAATFFRGASFNKSGAYIKDMCLSGKTSERIDETVENLDKISNQFHRDITITISTPPKTKGAYSIEVTDDRDEDFMVTHALFDDREIDKNTKLNAKNLYTLEKAVKHNMEYYYARGNDRDGKPILDCSV